MSQLIINTGTAPNTNDGDTVRNAFTKVNENFTEVYSTLSILTGGSGGGDTSVNIKGNVSALDDTVLVDASAGKITTAAIPSNVPLIYQFRANFDSSGNLDTITELPSEWSYTKTDNIASITHTVVRYPKTVSYLGHSTVGVLRLRFPTAGYEMRIPDSDRTTIFNINLNAAVTGADLSQYAYVVVTF